MAGNGPPPTPTRILEARGSDRASRGIRRAEFTPAPGIPEKPAGLTPEEEIFWDSAVEELGRSGILARIDQELLWIFCATHVAWLKSREKLLQLGETYIVERTVGVDTKTGNPIKEKILKKFPHVAAFREFSLQLMQIGAQFGMSPASRTRIMAGAVGGGGNGSAGAVGGGQVERTNDKRRFLRLA